MSVSIPTPRRKLGEMVRWRSQSAGVWKEKVGPVVAIIDGGMPVNEALERAGIRGRIGNPGLSRRGESYVVRASGRLYWPRVDALESYFGTAADVEAR